MSLKQAILGAALFSMALVAGRAQAQWPYLSDYAGYPGHYVNYYIPYFALHPPVYYSSPVSRTYGYSPFAYPPGVVAPKLGASGPSIGENRIMTEEIESPPPEPAEKAPKRIRNPYVPAAAGSDRVSTISAAGGPLVVYPAAMFGK